MANFQYQLDENTRWSPEAGGYINTKTGSLVSKAPASTTAAPVPNLIPTVSSPVDTANNVILKAKESYWQSKITGDTAGMQAASQAANLARQAGGTIAADQPTDIDRKYAQLLYDSRDTAQGSRDYLGTNYGIAPPQAPSVLPKMGLPQQPTQELPQLFPTLPRPSSQMPYTAPNYSITADPAGTKWMPTQRRREAFAQEEQNRFTSGLQGYNAQQGLAQNALSAGVPLSPIGAQASGLPQGYINPQTEAQNLIGQIHKGILGDPSSPDARELSGLTNIKPKTPEELVMDQIFTKINNKQKLTTTEQMLAKVYNPPKEVKAPVPVEKKTDPKESLNNFYEAKKNIGSRTDITKDQAIQYAVSVSDYLTEKDYANLLGWVDNNY